MTEGNNKEARYASILGAVAIIVSGGTFGTGAFDRDNIKEKINTIEDVVVQQAITKQKVLHFEESQREQKQLIKEQTRLINEILLKLSK
jgi:coenzyme F420-reducing hydrogenase delta subunit